KGFLQPATWPTITTARRLRPPAPAAWPPSTPNAGSPPKDLTESHPKSEIYLTSNFRNPTSHFPSMLSLDGCLARRDRLLSRVPETVEWLLVADPRHVYYLSNFLVNPLSFSGGERGLLLLE